MFLKKPVTVFDTGSKLLIRGDVIMTSQMEDVYSTEQQSDTASGVRDINQLTYHLHIEFMEFVINTNIHVHV